MIANFGLFKSVDNPRFLPISVLVRTAESLVSLPAAEIVKTTPTGRLFTNRSSLAQNFQISMSGFAVPCATAFAVSMTLPPPTANTKSVPNAMDSCTASLAKDNLGFGSTPPFT